jgi:hypothetical protein
MSHIFISYSKQDADFMHYLKALLEEQGFHVWVDEARLTASARWWKSIETSIRSCTAFVVIMSPSGYDSDWVEREILLAENTHKPIYPVLLAGEPWSRLANIQYEDMRAGLRARLSARLLADLRRHYTASARPQVEFTIVEGDITQVETDVAIFKHAQNFFGADLAAAGKLGAAMVVTMDDLRVKVGQHRLVETRGALGARLALFYGTPRLRHFGYQGIREFTAAALGVLAQEAPEVGRIAMTVHGPGASLDENESLLSQFAGYLDALRSRAFPPGLRRITLVELAPNRVARLRETLDQQLADADYATRLQGEWGYRIIVNGDVDKTGATEAVGKKSDTKPYAFVAIPKTPDLEDIFYYGIQGTAHATGLLCVRLDSGLITQEALEQLQAHIASARVVVAEVSASDPTVFLQLGYAWGAGRPTVLLARRNSALPFETPVVYYERIQDIESALSLAFSKLKSED